MGKTISLVKCKLDGKIFAGVYNGTSDCVERYFAPIDELSDFLNFINRMKEHEYQEPPFLEEHCIIYSDYGSGFWWDGTFDRNKRCVVKGASLDPIECEFGYDPEIHNERPQWVDEILEGL